MAVLRRRAGDVPVPRLAKAAGLGNVLVHQYAEVDDVRVVSFLDELSDLEALVTAVTAWMESPEGDPAN